MKSCSKKKIFLAACICVVFFSGVLLCMAIAGKIDLSGTPILGSLIARLTGNQASYTNMITSAVASSVTPSTEYTSITDLATANGYLYAADKTGQHVYKLSPSGTIESVYAAGTQVNGVCATNDAVYTLVGGANGTVTVLDSALQQTATVAVGHTPSAMAVYGNKAYVANRFDNTVSVLDLTARTVTDTIALEGREPIDMVAANGKLYVACHLPNEASTEAVVSADVVVIDLTTDKAVRSIALINGAGSVKSIAATSDGSAVFVSHIIARYAYPTTQLDRGWINTNGFSVIDTASHTVQAVLLDEVELGAANPWGIAVSEDDSQLVVALSGTDEVMMIDIAAMNQKIAAVKAGTGVVASTDKIADYLPFLDDCRTRISLNGKGARAVTVADGKAYIGQYFTGDIAVVDLTTKATATPLTVATQPENDAVRTGEILFSDANLCYQKWQSCLSCHPDALADGLNWDNMNDGLGNPKSAKSLLYSHRTPPVMVTGIRDTAETAVRAGMKFIQFNVMDETQLDHIDKYLMSLQPVQSPYRNTDGTLTESAQRGAALFESAGCVTCHPAPLYTDMQTHDVGTTAGGNWENRAMDTPTLVEVWRTGAWLHDGRYCDMQDVVRLFAPDLSDDEVEDLTNFVLSIGHEGEEYGVEQVFVTAGEDVTLCDLVPGGTIAGITVRRQLSSSASTAVVKAELTDPSGNRLASHEETLSNMAVNTAAAIVLGDDFTVPSENTTGTTFTITITDEAGKLIASPYILTY